MAERSSELEDLNDFGNSDRGADNTAAARLGEEIGVITEPTTTATGGYLSDPDADETRLATTATTRPNTSIATTADVTDVDVTGNTTTNDATATNVSPTDAVVDAAADPDEIKASIENTRTEMSETINAIQERLSISNIASQVKEEVSGQITDAYETVKSSLFGATVGKAEGFLRDMSKTTNQFLEDYGPAISDAGTTVVRTAKKNPIPFALIGAGVAMLLLTRGSNKKTRKVKSYRYRDNDQDLDRGRSSRSLRYSSSSPRSSSYTPSTGTAYSGASTESSTRSNQESTASKAYNAVGGAANTALSSVSGAASSAASTVSNAASSAASTVSNAASSAASGVSSAASSIASSVSNVANSAVNQVGKLGTGSKQVARRAQDTYERQLEENPFAVGGVAFALGAVVGLALPSTQIEGQLVGEYREELLQKAQDAAGGLIDKVQQVAGEVTKTVKEEAKAQGLTDAQ